MPDIFYNNYKPATKQIIKLDKNTKFKPLKGTIWIRDLDIGAKDINGIKIQSDAYVSPTRLSITGIHPRWATIFAVADDLKDEFQVGDRIYLKHGCWTDSFDFLVDNDIKHLWMIPKRDVVKGVLAKEV